MKVCRFARTILLGKPCQRAGRARAKVGARFKFAVRRPAAFLLVAVSIALQRWPESQGEIANPSALSTNIVICIERVPQIFFVCLTCSTDNKSLCVAAQRPAKVQPLGLRPSPPRLQPRPASSDLRLSGRTQWAAGVAQVTSKRVHIA